MRNSKSKSNINGKATKKRNTAQSIHEFRAYAFYAILLLATIAILLGEKDPVIWSFLTTASGILLGKVLIDSHN